MVEPTVYCITCHQRWRKLNKHVMDRQKVRVLEILAKAHLAGDEWVKELEGGTCIVSGQPLRAPYRARAHASRLVWFGLAEHGDPRSGLYRITAKGLAFLLNAATVAAAIYCKDGVVIERTDRQVGLSQVKGVILDKEYWDNYYLQQRYPKKAPTPPKRSPENTTASLF